LTPLAINGIKKAKRPCSSCVLIGKKDFWLLVEHLSTELSQFTFFDGFVKVKDDHSLYCFQTPPKVATPSKFAMLVNPISKVPETEVSASPRRSLRVTSPVKNAAEVAKKLFGTDKPEKGLRAYPFVSPSKRVPRRTKIHRIADRSEILDQEGFCSQWEKQHGEGKNI
jgi:hypothetical protein